MELKVLIFVISHFVFSSSDKINNIKKHHATFQGNERHSVIGKADMFKETETLDKYLDDFRRYGVPRKMQPKAESMSGISVRDGYYVDDKGRVNIFHGINVVQKSPPWYREDLLDKDTLQFLKDCGFNVIRLGMMWTGLYPEENKLNETYLSVMKETVESLGEYGMYVILDMHQDVLSSKYGTYDGFPEWVINKLPPPPHPFPWPFQSISSWFLGYVTEEVSKAFQGLFDNVSGIRDDFIEYWKTVVINFKDMKNVLGYELINEPWAGDIYSDPTLLLPGITGTKNLEPFYNILNDAIRSLDDEKIIFYEPVTWGAVFNGDVIGSGFSQVPGGPSYSNRSSFSYHYYCWFITPGDAHSPYPVMKKVLCDKLLGPQVFRTVQKDIAQTGGSSFVTEFGLCVPDGNPISTTTVECKFVLNLADEFLQSWTYWDLHEVAHVTWVEVGPFARVYARKTAGTPQQMTFNLRTKSFDFTYLYDAKFLNVPTEVFIPAGHYQEGFEVTKPEGVESRFEDESRILYVTVTSPEVSGEVKITINSV